MILTQIVLIVLKYNTIYCFDAWMVWGSIWKFKNRPTKYQKYPPKQKSLLYIIYKYKHLIYHIYKYTHYILFNNKYTSDKHLINLHSITNFQIFFKIKRRYQKNDWFRVSIISFTDDKQKFD